MTHFVDFVALGWVEKSLKGEIEAARRSLHHYQRESHETRHLQDAERYIHSATGALRLCTLEPAAMLSEEVERVLHMLFDGSISGDASKAAMTELVAAIEALPAYLATVRAKREVTPASIARVVNDLRLVSDRPVLPEALFFDPPLAEGAAVTADAGPASDTELRDFGARGVHQWQQHAGNARGGDPAALQQIRDIAAQAQNLLVGTAMEPCCRALALLAEVMRDRGLATDEAIHKVFDYFAGFLGDLAGKGVLSLQNAEPQHPIKHMLYYIGRQAERSADAQCLLDAYGIDSVEKYVQVTEGRMIQEDDLLDALRQTLDQLQVVMKFLSSPQEKIYSKNATLVEKIVPSLMQVGMQLHVIGLSELAASVNLQYKTLLAFAQRERPTSPADLVDFGGALSAIREEIEFKLKHGLFAVGNAATLDLEGAITDQVTHCLHEMKSGINRDFARQGLEELLAAGPDGLQSGLAGLRPVYRAARLIAEPELLEAMYEWEEAGYPDAETVFAIARDLLGRLSEGNYLTNSASQLEQVISVLGMMEDRERERDVLRKCSGFLNGSIALGGLPRDESMQCFTEVVAALEQFMECRKADPWGNPEQHLVRAEVRAAKLSSYLSQRANRSRPEGNVLEFGEKPAERRQVEQKQQAQETGQPATAYSGEPGAQVCSEEASLPAELPAEPAADEAAAETVAAEAPAAAATRSGTLPWREALAVWSATAICRPAQPLPEGPDSEIDRELLECFVEEFGEYINNLNGAVEKFLAAPQDADTIKDIRVVFHTLKGSARTIDLAAFGEFMYDMERIFNALRDNYIQGTAEMAEFVSAVAGRLPEIAQLIGGHVPLEIADFAVPNAIATAFEEKRFSDDMTVEVLVPAAVEAARGEPAGIEPEAVAADGAIEDGVLELVEEAVGEVLEFVAGETAAEQEDTGLSSGEIALEITEEGEVLEVPAARVDEPTPIEPEPEPVVEDVAYSAELWETGSAAQLLAAIAAELAAREPQPNREERQQALQLVASVVPAMVELRDAALIELTTENVGYFFVLGGMEHLASGAIYGLEENADGEQRIVSLSEAAVGTIEAYLNEQSDNPALSHLHNCAARLLHSALGLAAVDLPDSANQATPEAAQAGNFEAASAAADDYLVEDIDEELLDLFVETLDEYIESTDAATLALNMGDESALRDLKNTLHTVKGAANSVGLRCLGALVHDFESRIADLEFAEVKDIKAIQHTVDALVAEFNEAAQFVRRNRVDYDEEAMAAELENAEEEAAGEGADAPAAPTLAEAADQRLTTLRVETHKVDHLLDMGLEVSMANVRCRQALDEAAQDRTEINSLARRIQALVDQLSLQLDTEIQAKTEIMSEGQQFDPLEMDRITEKQALAAILREAAYDLQEESREMGIQLDNAIREVQSSSRLLQSSQTDLRQMRLVAFSKLGPGFRRLIHQVSRKLGKQVEFDFICGEGGLDISVFEQIRTALEHMLRNAIDHGIGAPEERGAQGKTDTGKVQLAIARRGSEFIIRLLDDGRGIDPDVLRDKAQKLGILKKNEEVSDEEALRLIFHSGFSTAEQVTDVSGRGVGMDVVYQSITQAGGTVDIQSKVGFYTQFEIRVPASIMVNEALLATVGEEQIAIPLTSLRGSEYLRRDKVAELLGNPESRVNFRGQEYELRYLGAVRGTLPTPTVDIMPDFVPVLFAQLERRRVAFFADGLATSEDLVIRSLGAQFTGVPGIAGGAVKSDGRPVLALDLNEFIAQVDHADRMAGGAKEEKDEGLFILCVDDSVMMRRTYEKRLGSLGYTVVTAVDGEDALDYLSQATRIPDFIFSDLEMPKMNGFDFIANLRRAPHLAHIPTVVVSSRDADKHRSEAQRVGANGFMAKGSNSAEGMQAMIARHLGDASRAKVS